MNFQSHEKQDEFVVKLQKYIKPEYDTDDQKYYLDVAAGDPVTGSNTYVLDLDFEWTGLAFDISEDLKQKWNKNEERTAEFSLEDVTSENFTNLLSMRKNKLYDYLSLDVDTATENKSHTALARILSLLLVTTPLTWLLSIIKSSTLLGLLTSNCLTHLSKSSPLSKTILIKSSLVKEQNDES